MTDLILEWEECFVGLTSKDVRRLVFEWAEELGIDHQFSKKTGLAGKDWLFSFVNRHGLSQRVAESTSSARINGFNEEEFVKFFQNLKKVQDDKNFTPSNIYNCDETGISVIPKCQSKIIAKKGRRRVGQKTSGERGETVTAEICVSATGSYLPPVLLFPRVKVNESFLEGKPAESWAIFNRTGWMDKESFTKWFEWFILQSHASPENPVLLLFDGHNSHVKNLQVAKLAIEKNVTLLCFPPHCSHRMQMLDVVFMKPLSNCYTEVNITFTRTGRVVAMKDIFHLFGLAFMKAAKVETAVKGFACTGVYPFNDKIFEGEYVKKINNLGTSTSSETTPLFPEYQKSRQILDKLVGASPRPLTSATSNIETESLVQFIPVNHVISAIKPMVELLSNYGVRLEIHKDFSAATSAVITNQPDSANILEDVLVQNENPDSAVSPPQSANTSLQQSNKKSKPKIPRKRGTSIIVTDPAYIASLEKEEAKKLKKDANSTKPKQKPTVKSNVRVRAPRRKVASNDISQTQMRVPLDEVNYQHTGQFVSLQPLQMLSNIACDVSENSSNQYLINNLSGNVINENSGSFFIL